MRSHPLDGLPSLPLGLGQELAPLGLPEVVEFIRLLPLRLDSLPPRLVQEAGHTDQVVMFGGLLALFANFL